jgi:hypothetical protein
MSKLKSFHFDLGNSNTGPIGMCARIVARTKRDAVRRLRDLLPISLEPLGSLGRGEYVAVYINHDKIRMSDIDDVAAQQDDSTT